ncbi:hypothetical protein SEQ_HALENA_98 [Mycobacterium phage Halena]|uniref:LIM zinc-binding domain-containing protein n=5 Tax=Bronvirus TaxID=1623278 RepID=A0A5Q2W9L7_9CAUD|nr:hypothetical protein FGG55_gp101 [Mycobacterium phage JoeDirt]YP_010105498.1 hypothetical protein KNU85_gp096 [Mycobacterium phage DirkDirk]YP_010114795.1 hypothetical protein KNV76_gp095 [Mycobacterium phage OhShagHennessy]ASR86079.1 hypothetical protein SEA_APPLETREE2_98 [Mycobacterium phage Appletree2]AYD82274.1 hypothetical protein SEA_WAMBURGRXPRESS_98 [Mycobacterium phage Wamburgrxpress]QBP29879.1 hypothetical protein SEQ_HALENA_98 [Mycobacterium phage Halena]QGJ93118.1 hypothetical 
MIEVYNSDMDARCSVCDDMIRRGDEVVEFAGELFHGECA